MSDLNLVEATALTKLVEKAMKKCKDNGEKITPGNHTFDVDIHLDGSLSRGEDFQANPSFLLVTYLKPLLLKYAMTLGKNEGRNWLEFLMDINGALGAVIQLGPETILTSVDPGLSALWNEAEAKAKEKFQSIAEKQDRTGQTIVVGSLEKKVKEEPLPKIVRSAKKK